MSSSPAALNTAARVVGTGTIGSVTPSEFAAKWSAATVKESAGSKEHFIDLCQMLGYQTPTDADPAGEWYAFEKGAEKTAGGDGFADVWKRGHFGWEYKGKKKDLGAAYKQLLDYREALENPPLLVVCDMDRFEVHTNFTNTVKQVYAFTLADLAVDRLRLRSDSDPAGRRSHPPGRDRRRSVHRHRRFGQSGIADPLFPAIRALHLERRAGSGSQAVRQEPRRLRDGRRRCHAGAGKPGGRAGARRHHPRRG